ncbi:unnamed protein product [Lathyrus oleraceus]
MDNELFLPSSVTTIHILSTEKDSPSQASCLKLHPLIIATVLALLYTSPTRIPVHRIKPLITRAANHNRGKEERNSASIIATRQERGVSESSCGDLSFDPPLILPVRFSSFRVVRSTVVVQVESMFAYIDQAPFDSVHRDSVSVDFDLVR